MIKHNKGWSLECLDKYDSTRGQARKANPRQSDFETGMQQQVSFISFSSLIFVKFMLFSFS